MDRRARRTDRLPLRDHGRVDKRTGDLVNGGGFLLLGLIGTLGLSVAAIDDVVHLSRATPQPAQIDEVLGEGTRGEAAVLRFEDGSTATLDEPARDDYPVGDRVQVWRDATDPGWVSDSPHPLRGTPAIIVVFVVVAGYGAVRLTTVLRRDAAHEASTGPHRTLTEPPR